MAKDQYDIFSLLNRRVNIIIIRLLILNLYLIWYNKYFYLKKYNEENQVIN